MSKIIANLNVVAWAGFWAFGYLALSADVTETRQMTVAAILAAMGAGLGLFAYLWLVRHSENTGYAKRPNRATPTYDNEGTV
jgi:hypothetical protein